MDRFLVTFEYQGMRNTIVILAHDESGARKALDYYEVKKTKLNCDENGCKI